MRRHYVWREAWRDGRYRAECWCGISVDYTARFQDGWDRAYDTLMSQHPKTGGNAVGRAA